MYILDVIPLVLIPRNQDQILSYFFDRPLPFGTVAAVPFNRRLIKAVVIGSDTLKARKLIYKKGVDFEMKNISKVLLAEPAVTDWQIKIASYLSAYYYASLGLCLKTVLPPFFFKKKKYNYGSSSMDNRRRQKFILIPEKIQADYYLQKYCGHNPIFLSSATPIKDYYASWQKVQAGQVEVIIGTRVGLFLPFANLQEIIVEDEANVAYKSDMTPRYHVSDLALFIAKLHGAKVNYTATVPRLETYQQFGLTAGPARARAQTVNMISERRAGNFSIFSRDLKNSLLSVISYKLKAILYIPRRGHANFLLCEHCGQIIKCPNCTASLVLHTLEPMTYNLKPALLCHHCAYFQPWPKSCPACGAYKFKSYGIGIEKVIAELSKFFKYSNLEAPRILRLDSDSIADETAEKKIVEDFRRLDSAILVATQMFFSQQPLIKADVCGIINADTLINIPDFRAEESLFRQLYTLGTLANELIIQTRNPDDPAIKFAAGGDVKGFFKAELSIRKDFNYPPFSQLIKLTYRHKDGRRAEREAKILFEKLRLTAISHKLEIDILGPSPAFISRERGFNVWNIVLKAPCEEIKKRNELLRLVPAGWVIDVDPRNII